MAASKPDLSRAGTMEVTAKEGTTFLNKNLTEWKKPYLMPEGINESKEESKEENKEESQTEAAAGNAEAGSDEAGEDSEPSGEGSDEDAGPAEKKVRLSKGTTMIDTAKEGKTILAGEKLADTRLETKLAKQRQANKLKRASTMAQTKQEAEAVYGGDLDLSEGRSLRKREEAKESEKKVRTPAMKKEGTMKVTAKEGVEFLKREPKKGNDKAKSDENE